MNKKLGIFRLLAMVVFLSFLFQVPALAADIYVDSAGVCGGNSPCVTTINSALGSATDGDTIHVYAGTYSEHLDINKPVNLIGAGASVTTIQSSNTSAEYLIRLGANTPITFSQGMVIEGFTLTGDLDGDSDLIMFRARTSNANDPIIIRNNVFDCVDMAANVKGIESRSGGNLTNVVIENNEFKNECRYCMWLNSAINWIIQDNTFTDAKYSALQINTSDTGQTHDIQIMDNTIVRTTTWPDREAHPEYAPYFAAIGLGSTVYNVVVRGNTIQGNYYHAIYMQDRGNVNLGNVLINCNNIVNNTHGSMSDFPAIALDAENNWWGNANGPYNATSNPGGTGDTVSDGFDFDPWLVATVSDPCPPPPAPSYTCIGFEPPMDKPVGVKQKNRVLPLKMVLLDENGMKVTNLIAPPIVDVDYSGGGSPTDPPGEDFLPAGLGDEGNQFTLTGSQWQFNLQTKNFIGGGTYTITVHSGDPAEYTINPTCTAVFVIY